MLLYSPTVLPERPRKEDIVQLLTVLYVFPVSGRSQLSEFLLAQI